MKPPKQHPPAKTPTHETATRTDATSRSPSKPIHKDKTAARANMTPASGVEGIASTDNSDVLEHSSETVFLQQRAKHHPAHLREQLEEHPLPQTLADWPMGEREIALQIEVRPRYLPSELDQIYLQGDHPQLKNTEHGLRLHRHPDGIWRNTVRLKAGEKLHFKIHRGDSETLAVDANGRPLDVHVTSKKIGSFGVAVEGWLDHDYRPKPSIQGRLDIYRKMSFPHLLPRDVLVWLPSSYDQHPTRRYPVLYMHDGQNLFDPATSYIGVEWSVDENIEHLDKSGKIDAPIVVGLKNTPDRLEEYAPTPKGHAYMRFVIEVVKPMIDARYRTRPAPEDTAVMGSSMGGLASFLFAWSHPEIFSKAGCLSPVFLNKKELDVDVCAWVEHYKGPKKDIRLYIDNGGLGLETQLMPGCHRMVELLENSGYRHGKDLAWFLDADAHHTESAWAARLWRPLTFLFGSDDPHSPLAHPAHKHNTLS